MSEIARPKLVREWVGLRCRTACDITNGFGSIEKGRLVTVTGTYRGEVGIQTAHCPECGVAWYCSKVSLNKLIPVERVAPPEPPRRRR